MSMAEPFCFDVAARYPDLLRDESRMSGNADSVSFPVTTDEVIGHLREAGARGEGVTVQGARTGITGGSVPLGGHILNLSRMKEIRGPQTDAKGCPIVTVQPGVLLSDIRKHLRPQGRGAADYFFPPDPTESSASIGGMIACNASGARSFHYGSTRDYVERVRIVLSDGNAVDLRRGAETCRGRLFALRAGADTVINERLPSYKMPDVKNAAGYFVEDDMDLLDLFIGSEGTLGVITEADLRLLPSPEVIWGVLCFLPSERAAVDFVESLRAGHARAGADAFLAGIEYFDRQALTFLREQRSSNPVLESLPEIDPNADCGVYVEYHAHTDDKAEDLVMQMSETMLSCGGTEDGTWVASSEKELSRLKDFRHAVPEAVNMEIDRRRRASSDVTKLGTDLAVPDSRLRDVIGMYRGGLEETGLSHVIFGHIGNNHLHVNILPSNTEEYERGKALYREWARAVVDMGGTVSAEHGIGKLKTAFLEIMYGERGISEMAHVKETLDPGWTLNAGNLFSAPPDHDSETRAAESTHK